MTLKAGLQLYSVGEAMYQAPLETIAAVGQMGYQGVEFAGYHGQSAHDLAQAVRDAGMVTCGSHIGLDQLVNDLAATLDFEAALGNRRVIVPGIQCDTPEAWYAKMATLDQLAEALAARGFQLIYHNHGHEVATFPGIDLLDQMTKRTQHVQLEVDTYWLAYAGIDVLAWLTAHADRIAMLHIKDMAVTGDEKESVILETGTLPLTDYLTFAMHHGVDWLVVEQEAFSQAAPVAAARQNAVALNQLIGRIEQ
ncbi:sugar phosphate isomerase/epimerase family protein [Lacticaseibacillus absianus]|uniref:sugar phosphate isomerase/epimerase family protein n=1 Tax=Lacticaseibacillus absianus TaxID=2729623 RepID=UPI0015CC037D|nr:sugar phosphate isomerase/epimerase [Lacticaseibacillus absianus]